ncbi:WxL protein peptidoglycan domain-containing protein [Weissella bombi]|uniref:WxL Interacting Protein peptidoglycan binding domain-containing protein n=1 Tax=Weissella bombi TaxID=1505725 RepID=A0A1C4AC88_9LACO|nr:DUF916 domain-containing protein [Weissella bombi]SCB92193.1 protein of unknown function [Weissella bombi]
MKILKIVRWQKLLMTVLMVWILLFLFNTTVFANEQPVKVYKNDQQTKINGYTVVPMFANNQDKNQTGYWHVNISTQKEQLLRFKIVTGDSEGNFNLSLHNAFTNQNLAVDYSNQAKANRYGHLNVNYDKQAIFLQNHRNQMHLRVPANHTAEVVMKLRRLDKSSNGTAVGGLHVVDLNGSKTSGTMQSQIAYSYAIVAKMGHPNKVPIHLRLADVKQQNHHLINYTIINQNNKLLQHAKIITKVYDGDMKLIQKNIVSRQATLTPHTKLHLDTTVKERSRVAKKLRIIIQINGKNKILNHTIN